MSKNVSMLKRRLRRPIVVGCPYAECHDTCSRHAVSPTLSIPRGQTAMAVGEATPDAKSFTLEPVRGSLTNGIVSNPFLEQALSTDRYTITVDILAGGTWSYERDTPLTIPGQSETFQHTDRNRLRKIAEPTPNPTALAAPQTAK